MSNTKKPNKQDQNNQPHHQILQQQKTRLDRGSKKRDRDAKAPDNVVEYHEHERIETRLTR